MTSQIFNPSTSMLPISFSTAPAINEHNWPERSLVYLCRLFDNLHAGDDYTEISPACHISILDFTLFPEQTEFYICSPCVRLNSNSDSH